MISIFVCIKVEQVMDYAEIDLSHGRCYQDRRDGGDIRSNNRVERNVGVNTLLFPQALRGRRGGRLAPVTTLILDVAIIAWIK